MARSDLIRPGDKFALIAASVGVRDLGSDPLQVDDALWVSGRATVSFADHWKDWLGSVRAQRLDDASVVITTRAPSSAPSVLDAENQELGGRVRRYFAGRR